MPGVGLIPLPCGSFKLPILETLPCGKQLMLPLHGEYKWDSLSGMHTITITLSLRHNQVCMIQEQMLVVLNLCRLSLIFTKWMKKNFYRDNSPRLNLTDSLLLFVHQFRPLIKFQQIYLELHQGL